MARLENCVFGLASGKIGGVVYRKRGGKVIVALAPQKRKSPLSADEIERQTKFGLTGKIAKAINSVGILKHFWKPTAYNGNSSYNIIFKENYRMVNAKDLSGPILAAPMWGFNLSDPFIEARKASLLIKCESMTGNPSFDLKVEKYICAAGVIVLKNPPDKMLPLHDVIAFKSKKQFFYPNKQLILDLEMTGSKLCLFQSYSIKKVSAVFVTMDKDENPIRHSITFSN